jgi:hypothetical protein
MATPMTPMKQQDETPRSQMPSQMPESNWGKIRPAVDKARDAAANVAEKAKDAASNVADKAKDAASTVGQKAEDATHAVGSGMQSLAGTMREKLPHEGVIGAATATVAGGLQNTGRYLQTEGLKGIGDDVTNLIRRNPLPAVLIGIGLGFILARATLRS